MPFKIVLNVDSQDMLYEAVVEEFVVNLLQSAKDDHMFKGEEITLESVEEVDE